LLAGRLGELGKATESKTPEVTHRPLLNTSRGCEGGEKVYRAIEKRKKHLKVAVLDLGGGILLCWVRKTLTGGKTEVSLSRFHSNDGVKGKKKNAAGNRHTHKKQNKQDQQKIQKTKRMRPARPKRHSRGDCLSKEAGVNCT